MAFEDNEINMFLSSHVRVCVFSALLALISVCILMPFVVHAEDIGTEFGGTGLVGDVTGGKGGFVPLAQTPGGSKLDQLYSDSSGSLSNFINALFKFGIAIGAIIAVLRLAYAGYLYMGQSEMWSSKGKAKEVITDVTVGLLILLSIYLILFQINPDIVKLKALDVIKSAPAQSGPGNVNGTASGNAGVSL